jgi:hypothetical protein
MKGVHYAESGVWKGRFIAVVWEMVMEGWRDAVARGSDPGAMATQKRSPKSEVRSPKPEARSPKSKA